MTRILLIALAIGTAGFAFAGESPPPQTLRVPLRGDGTIPAWLVAGPFEQGTQGFGEWRSVDAIGEGTVRPKGEEVLPAPLVAGGVTTWQLHSVDGGGYLDLNNALGWALPGRTPEQVWWTKAAYAYVRIVSPAAQRVWLLAGTNSQLSVFLNGTRVLEYVGHRAAVRDDDTVDLPLAAGTNHLLLKIGNTHLNHRSPFFGGITFGWGGYCRIIAQAGGKAANLTAEFEGVPPDPRLRIRPTFLFKRIGASLVQQHHLEFFSPVIDSTTGVFTMEAGGKPVRQSLPSVQWGWNRILIWHLARERDIPVQCRLTIGGKNITAPDTLRAERKYELHLVFLTHTDIGYTHTQPVVKELHCSALDQVLALCRKHPDFQWTIETYWQLDQYRRSRSQAVLDELYRYMREGRIALSPVSTNPYTGWVSEEEMARSLYPGSDLQRQLGITTPAAVYNDVPGLAWMLPRVLRDAGVQMLFCGLNEVYGGYTLQRALPKAFAWEGGDGTKLAVYRNETYSEGTDYGLERDADVIAHRMWERLHRLRASGEDRAIVILNSAWFDNGPPAAHQFETAKRWNAEYAYPRFVVTTAAKAARVFLREYGSTLPHLRGDWTSSWDMLYQGEPARVVRERAVQQRLIAAEALDAVTTFRRPELVPATRTADAAYAALLEYSGHGSGLESGFGTPRDNALAMEVREDNLRDATGLAIEIYERALTRIIRAEEDFEAEGVIVLNPLSWRCTVPVEIELKDSSEGQFQVTDLATGRGVPSIRRGHSLRVVLADLPPMGFRKYVTVRRPGQDPDSRDLRFGATSIENQYYHVAFDPAKRRINSIFDKQAGRELVASGDMPFNEPLVQVGIADRGYRAVWGDSIYCAIEDERPVRVVLSILRPGGLVGKTEYVLWTGVDRLDISHTVNLGRLRPPEEVEVFAAAFPLAFSSEPTAFMDVLGGYLEPARDRLPGALKDVFSIRRSAAVTDGRVSVTVAAADSRIVFWKDDARAGGKLLLANLVNNFPLQWNRNEENSGQLKLRFAIRSAAGSFDPDATSRFGWEVQTEFPGRATLLRRVPAEQSYLSLAGRNVVLSGVKRGRDTRDIVLRLTNVSPDSDAHAVVTSDLLLPAEVSDATLLETRRKKYESATGSFQVALRPSETMTLLVRKRPP